MIGSPLLDMAQLPPPEALSWVDGDEPWNLGRTPQDQWRWALMVMQPAPIDALTVESAVEHDRAAHVPDLELLRYERWAEGRCAQVLHVGPYDAETPVG